MSKGDQGVRALGGRRGVKGRADSVLVDIETGSFKAPRFVLHAPQQGAHERQSTLVKRTHAIETHDLFWPSQRNRCAHDATGPKLSAKNRYQLSPISPATSSDEKPTAERPASMFPKSRLVSNQSGCGGKPGADAEPSP